MRISVVYNATAKTLTLSAHRAEGNYGRTYHYAGGNPAQDEVMRYLGNFAMKLLEFMEQAVFLWIFTPFFVCVRPAHRPVVDYFYLIANLI